MPEPSYYERIKAAAKKALGQQDEPKPKWPISSYREPEIAQHRRFGDDMEPKQKPERPDPPPRYFTPSLAEGSGMVKPTAMSVGQSFKTESPDFEADDVTYTPEQAAKAKRGEALHRAIEKVKGAQPGVDKAARVAWGSTPFVAGVMEKLGIHGPAEPAYEPSPQDLQLEQMKRQVDAMKAAKEQDELDAMRARYHQLTGNN